MFGEISFFSGRPRTVSAKSKNFCETMYLDKLEFMKNIASKYPHAFANVTKLIEVLNAPGNKSYHPLYSKCYHCKGRGHIAIDCDFFYEISGNMQKKYIKQATQIHEHQEKEKNMQRATAYEEQMRKLQEEATVKPNQSAEV